MSAERITGILVGAPPSSLPPGVLESIPDFDVVRLADASPAQLATAELALVWDFRWRGLAEVLERAPRLRWIHAGSAGVDHLLPALLERPDIELTNSAGVFERPIAEYVLGLLLAHAKGFAETSRAQAERRWAYRETADLDGGTLVVVGAGRIGTAIARIGVAVGLRAIGVRRTAAEVMPPFERIVGVASLADVIGVADFVVVATPATSGTERLIDAAVLAAMRPTAYLVNIGRSSAVDTAALVAALKAGTIAGAALDVFDEEPLPPSHPLWRAPNLFVSPHMSGDAAGWAARIVELFGANVRAWRSGAPLQGSVDRTRGY